MMDNLYIPSLCFSHTNIISKKLVYWSLAQNHLLGDLRTADEAQPERWQEDDRLDRDGGQRLNKISPHLKLHFGKHFWLN